MDLARDQKDTKMVTILLNYEKKGLQRGAHISNSIGIIHLYLYVCKWIY